MLRMALVRMPVFAFALFLGACGAIQPTPIVSLQRPESPFEISTREIGITLDRATTAFGMPFNVGAETLVQVKCSFVYPQNNSGFALMVVGNIVVRIDVTSPNITVLRGISVGSPEQDIFRTHTGSVQVLPHPFMSAPARYIVTHGKGGIKVVFETNGNTITQYRVGASPYVDWIEGCL